MAQWRGLEYSVPGLKLTSTDKSNLNLCCLETSLEAAPRMWPHVPRRTQRRAKPWASQGIAVKGWEAQDLPKHSEKKKKKQSRLMQGEGQKVGH